MSTRYLGPLSSPNFKKQVASVGEPPLTYVHSGEFTATKEIVFPSPRTAGQIAAADLSVLQSGKDDDTDLSVALEVRINGTSIMDTDPVIAHVSGEASMQKSTMNSADTGITLGVVGSSNTYSPGDIIGGQLYITRTASPATEITDVVATITLLPS